MFRKKDILLYNTLEVNIFAPDLTIALTKYIFENSRLKMKAITNAVPAQRSFFKQKINVSIMSHS